MRTQKRWFRCSCGSSVSAWGAPAEKIDDLVDTVRRMHVEEKGHREVDARELKRIRARQDRERRRRARIGEDA